MYAVKAWLAIVDNLFLKGFSHTCTCFIKKQLNIAESLFLFIQIILKCDDVHNNN